MGQQNHLKNKEVLIPCWNRNYKLIKENPLGNDQGQGYEKIRMSEDTLQYNEG